MTMVYCAFQKAAKETFEKITVCELIPASHSTHELKCLGGPCNCDQCACFRDSIHILKITFLGWDYDSPVRVLV